MDDSQPTRDRSSRNLDRSIREVKAKTLRKRFWIAVLFIFIVSVLLGMTVNFLSSSYDRFINYYDPSYRPMDIERKYQDLVKWRR